jgi:hypothetical protein
MISLGYREPSGRQGQYTMPNITVDGGTIEAVENGPYLAQFEIQNGLINANQTLNQVQSQYNRQLQKYNTILDQYNAIVATDSISNFNTLSLNINDLYNAVATDSVGTIVYKFNLSGYFLRMNAGGISPTSFYTLGTPQSLSTGMYFVSVKIALSCVDAQNATVIVTNGLQTITNNRPTTLNGCYTQVVFKVNGVVYTTRTQSVKTFRGTNIFMNCSTYLQLDNAATLSIEWAFVCNNSIDVDTTTSGFCWMANQTNKTQNITAQASFIQPNTATINNPTQTNNPPAGFCNLNTDPSPSLVIWKLT